MWRKGMDAQTRLVHDTHMESATLVQIFEDVCVSLHVYIFQSAEAAEYTDYISADG